MNSSEIKSKSLAALNGRWGQAIGLTVVIFLLNVLLMTGLEIWLMGGFEIWVNQETTVLVDLVNIVVSILLVPFIIGVYWYYLDLYTDKNPKISSVFKIYEDGKISLKTIVASILQTIFLFLWSLLLIIPGIIKTFSYSQTFYIMKEHPELSALEAITESRKRMVGFKWKYFYLNLSFLGWFILSILTLGIGFLWLIPYMSTSIAAFYKENISTLTDSPTLTLDTEKDSI